MVAAITLKISRSDYFPIGTVVQAYPASARQLDSAPAGTEVIKLIESTKVEISAPVEAGAGSETSESIVFAPPARYTFDPLPAHVEYEITVEGNPFGPLAYGEEQRIGAVAL